LRFIKGCDNVVADALSRIEINSIFQHAAKIDWHAFAKAQWNDYELKRYLDETNSSNVIKQEWNGATLLCDVSRDGTPPPLVPCGFRRIVFDNCHNLTHCGIRATIKFISETHTWPNLKKDCTVLVQSCVPCQQTKVRPYTKSACQHYPLTNVYQKSMLTWLGHFLNQMAIATLWCVLTGLHTGSLPLLCQGKTFTLSSVVSFG